MNMPRVLFLCTANSCRSQMAEGFLRHLAGDRFEAASARAHPTQLNPDAVSVMKERGIDISTHRSKDVTEFWKQRVQYVITVCDKAREACPIFPFALTSLDWSLDDPGAAQGTEAERLAVFAASGTKSKNTSVSLWSGNPDRRNYWGRQPGGNWPHEEITQVASNPDNTLFNGSFLRVLNGRRGPGRGRGVHLRPSHHVEVVRRVSQKPSCDRH